MVENPFMRILVISLFAQNKTKQNKIHKVLGPSPQKEEEEDLGFIW